MSLKTYITKNVKDLNWNKVPCTCFKISNSPVPKSNCASVIYQDMSSVGINDIDIVSDKYLIEGNSIKTENEKVVSIKFNLKCGDTVVRGEVYCGFQINVVKIFDNYNLPEGEITFKLIKRSGTIEVPTVISEYAPSYIYHIKLDEIETGLAEGPIMINNQVVENYDYKALRGINFYSHMYYFYNNELYVNIGKDVNESEDTISICKDYSNEGLDLSVPCRIIPRDIGSTFKVVDSDGNQATSSKGFFPNLDYYEGSKLYGVLLADIVPLSNFTGSSGESVSPDISNAIDDISKEVSDLETTITDLSDRVEKVENTNESQLDIG